MKKSAFLWHRRLGHVSKERLKILVKNNILNELDFSDLNDCVECFKGKITNLRKKTAYRSRNLLELIHTDICGPFRHQTICGNVYFITFIDDFSRYCYVYLLSEKSQALKAFQVFKLEVENQLEKKIKTVRSDRGGEFYGKYTESGQQKGPFALFLQEHGIKAQYTTPFNPQQNGVAERKNRTLLNMVRCMMCTTGLPKFLWGEALKTANYICNRTPSKAIEKTSFELWCGRKPSLFHCHVWGCHAEARIYNPNLNKLDSKTVSCYFIGYPDKSKGYKLYSAKHSPRIFETHQVKFLSERVHNTEYEDLTSDFEEVVTNVNIAVALPLETETVAAENLIENQDAQDQVLDQEVHLDEVPAVPQVMHDQPPIEEPENNPVAQPNPENSQPRRSQRARKPTYRGGR
jgi:transposase InsO family protein